MIVGYGHSYVAGVGASTTSARFLDVAGRMLATGVDGRGESASTAAQTATLLAVRPPPSADAYVVMSGYNEAYDQGSSGVAQYRSALRQVVNTLRSGSPTPTVVLVEQPRMPTYPGLTSQQVVDAYNAALREVAEERGARVAFGWQWGPHLVATDGMHPNDAGHAALARAVADVISPPLVSGVLVRVGTGTPPVVPSGQWTLVAWPNLLAASNPAMTDGGSRLVAPAAGQFEVRAAVQFPDGYAGIRGLAICRESAGSLSPATVVGAAYSSTRSVSVEATVSLRGGEYVEVFAYQDSGGPLSPESLGYSPAASLSAR